MDYDEKYFKISANKKALRMWVIIGLALTGAYIAECVKGARTVPYTVLFCFICWVPLVSVSYTHLTLPTTRRV